MLKRFGTLRFTVLLPVFLTLALQPAIGQECIPALVMQNPIQLSSHITETQARSVLGLSASDVISITFGTSSHDGYDIFSTPATLFPTEGGSYLVMSSGATSSAFLPNAESSLSTELDGLNTTAGEDLVQIVLQLQPPPGATCLFFDFAFYSEEFPKFVGSEFNDAFIAEIGQSTPNYEIPKHRRKISTSKHRGCLRFFVLITRFNKTRNKSRV